MRADRRRVCGSRRQASARVRRNRPARTNINPASTNPPPDPSSTGTGRPVTGNSPGTAAGDDAGTPLDAAGLDTGGLDAGAELDDDPDGDGLTGGALDGDGLGDAHAGHGCVLGRVQPPPGRW